MGLYNNVYNYHSFDDKMCAIRLLQLLGAEDTSA